MDTENSTAFVSNQHSPEQLDERSVFDVKTIWLSVSCGTVLLNGIILTLLLKHRTAPGVKSIFDQFLFLVITDIVVGFSQFLYFVLLDNDVSKNIHVCRTIVTCYMTSQVMSFGNIFGFSVRRFLSIRNMHRLNTKWQRIQTQVQVAANIFGGSLTVFYLVVFFKFNGEDTVELCNVGAVFEDNSSKILAVPLIISLTCTIGTDILCLLSIRRLRKITVIEPIPSVSIAQTQLATSRKETEQHATYTLCLVFAALNLCALPTIFAGFLVLCGVNVTIRIRSILYNVNACNSLLNPLLYFAGLKTFRKIVLRSFKF